MLSLPSMSALTVDRLSKRFRGGVQALADLSLSVPTGGVYGLLGPNGAGKSTLLRIVTGLVRPDTGSIALFGQPASVASRRVLGALVESPSAYPFLTATELLRVIAYTAGIPAMPVELLDRVGLAHAADQRVGSFSLGMKQRLGLAAALVGEPRLLVFDEPTNGLDPEGIMDIRRLVRDLADRDGLTVLLSSHLLDEVERVCDRVAILSRGRLIAEGRVTDLLAAGEQLWLDVDPVETALARLGAHGVLKEGRVVATIAREDVPALLAALAADGVRIFEARWRRPDLESVFFAATGADAR
jgi:ABC-2 type transport system ATP-binding protein